MATSIHACSLPPRIATHVWMCQLQRVIRQVFLTSPCSFNFCSPQFYFEGLSFLSPLLCAACYFRGCQRAPGFAIALGRQTGNMILPVHLNLFPAVVSLLFLCTSPVCPGPAVFRQSPATRPIPRCNTSSAHGPWGELRYISSSEHVVGAGEHQAGLCSSWIPMVQAIYMNSTAT